MIKTVLLRRMCWNVPVFLMIPNQNLHHQYHCHQVRKRPEMKVEHLNSQPRSGLVETLVQITDRYFFHFFVMLRSTQPWWVQSSINWKRSQLRKVLATLFHDAEIKKKNWLSQLWHSINKKVVLLHLLTLTFSGIGSNCWNNDVNWWKVSSFEILPSFRRSPKKSIISGSECWRACWKLRLTNLKISKLFPSICSKNFTISSFWAPHTQKYWSAISYS